MTELRRQMLQAMTVRGMAGRTQQSYVSAVRRLAKHYRRSPDQLTADEVQSYLARMIEVERLSWSTCSVAANAFRFLYHVALGRPEIDFVVPRPRQPQRLPEILSCEEVSRLLASVAGPKHRLVFETIYACGLRVSEAIHLKVRDIDRDRMTVRIEQGKGCKDRYVPLSKRLLRRLEQSWTIEAPRHWVFEGSTPDRCLHVTAVQKAYTLAKLRAGIQKHGGVHALRHAYATHMIEAGRTDRAENLSVDVPARGKGVPRHRECTGERLRRLSIDELVDLELPVENLIVQSRSATIGIILEPQPNGSMRVVVQGFMNARFLLGASVALDGFYKHPDGSVSPMPNREFYEYD